MELETIEQILWNLYKDPDYYNHGVSEEEYTHHTKHTRIFLRVLIRSGLESS